MSVIEKINDFYQKFDGKKGVIGYSVKGNPLYYLTVEKTKNPIVIVQYGIHAREFITSLLALKQIEEFNKNGRCGTVHFLPLTNPDGAIIAENIDGKYKANARGVDLNVNFDACWGKGKSNVKIAGAQNYIGKRPFSEPETKAIKKFTLSIKPSMTISYHSKGEEIYWEFFQRGKRARRDYSIAKAVADCTGYSVGRAVGSCGGYKDWCIKRLKVPALTIEVGEDSLIHPIKENYLDQIYKKNERVISVVIKTLMEKRWN